MGPDETGLRPRRRPPEIAETNMTSVYYQTITEAADSSAVIYELLDVLGRDIGVKGVFSDWPATVTYYANCMKLGDASK